jgi:hypothetical protein
LTSSSDVLPDSGHDAAKDLGVVNVASLLPQSFAPAVAPVFLSIGFGSLSDESGSNHLMLFAFAALSAVLSAVFTAPIRGVR